MLTERLYRVGHRAQLWGEGVERSLTGMKEGIDIWTTREVEKNKLMLSVFSAFASLIPSR